MTASPIPGVTHDEWILSATELAIEAQAILGEPLSPHADTLRSQASKTEDLYVEVAEAASAADAWLCWHEAAEMGKIDKDLTVKRQEVELRARMIPHRLFRDRLEALSVSLKSRMRRAAWSI